MFGYYINKRRKPLHGQKAMFDERSGQYLAQFTDRNLPMSYTHRWMRVHQNNVLVYDGHGDGKINLIYKGRRITRTIRNGKFDFHGTEITL